MRSSKGLLPLLTALCVSWAMAAPGPLANGANVTYLPTVSPGGAVSLDAAHAMAFPESSSWTAETLAKANVLLVAGNERVNVNATYSAPLKALIIRPVQKLQPGTQYTLTLHAGQKREQLQVLVNGRKDGNGVNGTLSKDGLRWIPDLSQKRDDWTTDLPDTSLPEAKLLRAPAGTTAISGQVRLLNGKGLSRVRIQVGRQEVRTDVQGRFLLNNVPAGSTTLLIDARTANSGVVKYGTYQQHLQLTAGKTNFLPQTIWISRNATEYATAIASPTTGPVVLKNPEIPGLEIRIPKGAVIKDLNGNVVKELTLTPIPIDRAPFALPRLNVPTYFTVQPGGARIYAADGKTPLGAQVVYPNYSGDDVGAPGIFWNYDPLERGWYTYGRGAVSRDGRQVIPNEGVQIYAFTGAMFNARQPDPDGPPTEPDPDAPTPDPQDPDDGSPGSGPGDPCQSPGGNPVDCSSGHVMRDSVDLVVNDTVPIVLSRSFIQDDSNRRSFGKAWSMSYDMFLYSKTYIDPSYYKEVDWVLPNGRKIHYVRTVPGTGFTDFKGRHFGSSSEYYGSTVAWDSTIGGWRLTMKDGSYMRMPETSMVTEMVDRNGNKINITRNGNAPQRITSPSGKYIDLTLDGSNRITAATTSDGRTVSYTYDADGYLTTVTFPDGTTEQYTYASYPNYPHKMLVSVKDRRNVIKTTTEFSKYIAKLNTQFQWEGGTGPGSEGGGTLIRTATATVPTSASSPPPTGEGAGVDNTTGSVLKCTVYKPTKQTYADGGVLTFEWTLDNYCRIMQVKMTDPRGNVTIREFNISGSLMKETVAAGTALQRVKTVNRTKENPRYSTSGGKPPTTVLPNDPGNDSGSNFVRSIVDSAGRTTTFTYDAMGNPTRSVGPQGTVSATYNSLGQALTITNELNQTITFSYDARGNLTQVKDALSRITTMIYNDRGQLTTVQAPLNRVTTFQYDGPNLISITDPIGRTSTFTYNQYGWVSSRTDPLGRVTRYQYDINGQLAKAIASDGSVTAMQYDAHGNLQQVKDPLDRIFKWNYDWGSRITSATDPLNQSEKYVYDLGGNVTQFTDRKNQDAAAVYDTLNRRISATDIVGTIAYEYNDQDQITSVTENGRRITYAYDSYDRLKSETTPEGTIAYTYDVLGKRTGMSINGGNSVTYAYDDGNRLIAMTRDNQAVIFTYDDADRITGVSLPNGVTGLYVYDPADQLIEIRYMRGSTLLGNLIYTYDEAGQRTSTGGSFARTILPASASEAVYDGNNRANKWKGNTLEYDANGNLTSDGFYSYIWNSRNQLTQVKQGANIVSQYSYDANGRRYSRNLNGDTTTFLYDGINAIQERSGNTTTNFFGAGVDNYFSKSTGEGALTYLKDALGSTLGLVNANGAFSSTYVYGPYGETIQTGNVDSNSNQYAAREKDAGNLYYYRARYYNSELGRFISQDPIGLEGGINWYAYANGNPVQISDPYGLWGTFVQGGVSADAGFLFGGAGASYAVGNVSFNGSRKYESYDSAGGAAYFGPINGSIVKDPSYPQNPGMYQGPGPMFIGAQASGGVSFGITNANNFGDFSGAARTTTLTTPLGSISFGLSKTGIMTLAVSAGNMGIGVSPRVSAGFSLSSFNTETRARPSNAVITPFPSLPCQ
ncbi:RHS repeat domain-containing protein [Deinococcus arcticus]|uniref:RHS repeat domain-containing protein n=1 Tax=Deinococcus arcticus TaxID=2136176 RepID=UPI0011B1E72F|nr:RHS repeat-associated core domain-containing protein [Deinococcus arcticus]